MKLTAEQIFNRERFEAWLVGQPLTKSWDYLDNDGCLLASYLKHVLEVPQVWMDGFARFCIGDYEEGKPLQEGPQWAERFSDDLASLRRHFTTNEAIAAYNYRFSTDLLAMDSVTVPQPLPLPSKQSYGYEA